MSELNGQGEHGDQTGATAGRFFTFRRVALISVVVAGLAVGGVVVANEVRLAPLRVTPHAVSTTPGPLKVAANESIPESGELEAGERVIEDTSEFSFSFAQSLGSVRAQWNDDESAAVTAVADECLSAWAKEHLAEYAGTSQYDVVNVCGRPTAIVVGASGIDDRVLVYNAVQKDAPANVERVRGVLVESTSSQMAFASVRSSDASIVLMAAAALPEAAHAAADEPEVTPEAGSPEGPPIVNVRPPGVEIVPFD